MSVFFGTAFAVISALRFWVLNLPTLVGLTWFPLALVSLTTFAWSYWDLQTQIWHRQHPGMLLAVYPPLQGGTEGTLFWLTLHLIALSASATAVHRFMVLGDARPGGTLAFPFGRAERAYFLLGITAYILMFVLVLGQSVTQLEWPSISDSLVSTVLQAFADLGPWALSLFIFPGELPVLTQPPLNYALWVLLAIAACTVLIRLSPWTSIAATEERFALADSVRLTSGATGAILLYGFFVALCLVVVMAVLAVSGLGFLAAEPDGIARLMQSFTGGTPVTAPNEDPIVQYYMHEITLAGYFEIVRFISSLLGVTLGAVLTSGLHLYLRRLKG
jgi:hypothetical protein